MEVKNLKPGNTYLFCNSNIQHLLNYTQQIKNAYIFDAPNQPIWDSTFYEVYQCEYILSEEEIQSTIFETDELITHIQEIY